MRLTKKEKAVFTMIEEPVIVGGKRLTRPVVITYYEGMVVGIDSVTSWRRFMERFMASDCDKSRYTFELRNMWP